MIVDYGTKYYSIIIEDKETKLKLYHCGKGKTPTKHFGLSKTYYSLAGAKQGLKSVKRKIGGNLKAYIEVFYHNLIPEDFS